MAQEYTDDFNRSNENLEVSADWAKDSGQMAVTSNQVTVSSAPSAYIHQSQPSDADQYAQVKRTDSTADGTCGILLRTQSATSDADGYLIQFRIGAAGNDIIFYRVVSGGYSNIGSNSGLSYAQNDVLRAEITGVGGTVTIKAFKNGASTGAAITDTDAARHVSNGYAGIRTNSTSRTMDDFESGSLAYDTTRLVTIDNTKVEGSANFTDFPLLFSGTYDGTDGEPDLRSAANGGDVQNTDASGGIDGSTTVPADLAFYDDTSRTTKYDHEIVRYNASTGEIVAYVRIPTLKYDTDTELYLHYDNDAITLSQENIDGAWASAYKGVWHMEGASLDSSGNSQDGSDTDISYATGSGNIGQGAESPGGAGDNINIGNDSIFDWTSEDFTIAFWAYMTSTTNGEIILTRGDYNNDGYYVAYRYSAPNWGLEMYTSQSSAFQRTQTLYNCNLNTWYRIVINRSGTDVDIWQNGTEFTYSANGTHTNPATSSRNLYMFAYDGGVLPIPGYLDEVMMVEEYWGDDRIKTDYNSQNSPSTFYSIEAGSSTIQSMGFGDEGFIGS